MGMSFVSNNPMTDFATFWIFLGTACMTEQDIRKRVESLLPINKQDLMVLIDEEKLRRNAADFAEMMLSIELLKQMGEANELQD